ncbi:hypothetical protein [Chryseolinea sp. H1M3-3]|uniref:hypothetical protein n=1 Tax=Chryseolinea sp. H1M3-3 TaxID=3034144 RepID=UPI0023EB225B|nr:hypothetical protein [Chryseolinea sp. H1M3-3]
MRFPILTILTFATTTLFGQTVQKCDGPVLSIIADKIGKANQKEIADFLLTFGEECRNNIEYSEWSNELLFSLLDKQTDLTVNTIEKEEKRLEMEAILEDLSSPLLDPNIKDIISRIERVKIKKELKDKIIERLRTADGKAN